MTLSEAAQQAKALDIEDIFIGRAGCKYDDMIKFVMEQDLDDDEKVPEHVLRYADEDYWGDETGQLTLQDISASDWMIVDLKNSEWKEFFELNEEDHDARLIDKNTKFYMDFDTPEEAKVFAIIRATQIMQEAEDVLLGDKPKVVKKKKSAAS